MFKFLIPFTVCFFSFSALAQDTVSVMYYNLLKFPFINSGRINNLQKVLAYTQPDILVVNELTSGAGANSILPNALNTNGISKYDKAMFSDGPDTDNMLYYNKQKFGLLRQGVVSTVLRDINEYILFYKEANMTASSDTIYFYVYGLHLKAGNSQNNENQRALEVSTLKAHLSDLNNPENVLVGGDFNIYSSSEQAYSGMTSGNGFNLNDGLGLTGNYNNNAAFTNHFTQSTRTISIDGGATGGMDDRFDMIFYSDDMISGAHKAKFIPSSYRPVGQDGLHFNQGLLNVPANTTVPSDILSALYYMSDHLPIRLELELDVTLSDNVISMMSDARVWAAHNTVNIVLSKTISADITLYDLSGKIVKQANMHQTDATSIKVENLSSGIYSVVIRGDNFLNRQKLWIP